MSKRRHHFLPNKDLKKRAKLLSHNYFFLYALSLIPLLILFRATPKAMPGVLGYSSKITIQELLSYTNKERAKAGAGDLVINDKLTKAAEKKAEDMFKKDYWAHVSPEGTEPWSFILAEKYDYTYAGENLAKNFSTSKEVVEAWYKSPSHRENLLNPNFYDVGFAVKNGVLDGYETTLVVQMFGKVRGATAPAPSVEPAQKQVKSAQVPETAQTYSNAVVNVPSASKTSFTAFLLFLIFLLLADIWYTRKYHILKNTGHTFAHLLFLTFTITALWIILTPGRIY